MDVQGIENKEIRDLIAEYLNSNEQGMRELMTWFLNQVMDHEAEQQSGAGRYVRGKGRRAHRNGHSTFLAIARVNRGIGSSFRFFRFQNY